MLPIITRHTSPFLKITKAAATIAGERLLSNWLDSLQVVEGGGSTNAAYTSHQSFCCGLFGDGAAFGSSVLL